MSYNHTYSTVLYCNEDESWNLFVTEQYNHGTVQQTWYNLAYVHERVYSADLPNSPNVDQKATIGSVASFTFNNRKNGR